MHIVKKINTENLQLAKSIYDDFKNKAIYDYEYSIQPIEFQDFAENIKQGNLNGYILIENGLSTAILIYTEDNGVLEVNAAHSLYDKYENNRRLALTEELVNNFNNESKINLISYAMLGRQSSFVKDISLLGFNFVGQSVVKFDFQSTIAFRIFKKAQISDIKDYQFAIWDEKYKDQLIDLTHKSFKNTKNACFDPRFLTYDGTQKVIEMIIKNQFGKFLPSQCRLLLKNGNLEAYCLATMVDEDKLNIPLIATKKNYRNKGIGKIALKSVLADFYRLIGDKKIILSEINATVDTDNYPAVKMYRRLGFKEEYFYPHAFLAICKK